MVLSAGRYRLGPGNGRLLLRTFRDGLASRAGHDLTIEVAVWSGELTVADQLTPSGLDVRIDMTSLTVREGSGGISPLTDRDRREIAATARKVLATERYPEALFHAEQFGSQSSPRSVVGTLTLHGQARTLRVEVDDAGNGQYHAVGSVTQSDYGIKPYTGFLGALRVRDVVDFVADVDIVASGGAGGK